MLNEEIKVQIEAQERLAAKVPASQTKENIAHETHNEEIRKSLERML